MYLLISYVAYAKKIPSFLENPRQIGKSKNAERAIVMRFLASVF
jgi:hypothetical protein